MPDRKIIILYFSLLVCYIAHVFEEILGNFMVIQLLGSVIIYIIINIMLFLSLLAVLFYLRRGKRIAILAAIFFSAIMVINGLGHNLAALVTGKYYNGFAGGITGLGLMLIGIPLFILLNKYYKSRFIQKNLELP